MSPPSYKQEGTYVDRVLTPGMTPESIRQAVKAGKMVVAVDNAGIAVQIDKALLARIDRRRSKFFPCTTSQKPKTP